MEDWSDDTPDYAKLLADDPNEVPQGAHGGKRGHWGSQGSHGAVPGGHKITA
jgi:hypothetical protein